MNSQNTSREEAVHKVAARLANTAQVLEAWAEALGDSEDLLHHRLDRAIQELGRVVGALTVSDEEFLNSQAGADSGTGEAPTGRQDAADFYDATGLSGRSEMISLIEFISFLSSVNKSGVLKVNAGELKYTIELRDGKVVFAALAPEHPERRLGNILLAQGALTEEEMKTGSGRARKGEFLGASLVRQGLVEQEELVRALDRQAMMIFRHAHTTGTGFEFQFDENIRIRQESDLYAGISFLLLESARMLDEETNAAEELAKAVEEERESPAPENVLETFRSRLRAVLDAGEFELPVLPNATGKLLALCWSDDHDPEELLACVNRDQTLCAHLLRIANSVAYAPATPISSVQLAITRLGMLKLREITMALTLRKEIFRVPRWSGLIKELWHCAAVTSGFGDAVARACSAGAARGSTAGLLLDIGKPIVLGALNDIQQELDVELNLEDAKELLEEFHAEMGEVLAVQWSLPDWIQSVVRHHHEPSQAEDHGLEVMIGNLANELAQVVIDKGEPDLDEIAKLPACEELGIGTGELEQILAKAARVLEMATAYA